MFSNSLLTDLSLWDSEEAALGKRCRILRYDQRGHGASSLPKAPCTFDQFADDAVAILDSLGIESVILVGISMGAATAINLAARYPTRLRGLVVCDVGSGSGPNGRALWDERFAYARAHGMDGLAEITVRRWFRPGAVDAALPGVEKARRMVAATPLEGFVAAANALQDFDLLPCLPRIRTRTLVMVGSHDGTLPEVMRTMSDAIAGAEFRVIPEAGHLINLEQPTPFHEALQSFL
jgi:3-oxoadipate enol-lactonase